MPGMNLLSFSPAEQQLGPGALLALILLAAVTGGYVVRLLRVPRVVGYLLAGVALRYLVVALFWSGHGSLDAQHLAAIPAQSLQPIKTLALGLILFTIGGVFETGHLKRVGAKVFRISVIEVTGVGLLVAGGCTIAWLITVPGGSGQAITCGALLGALAIATAPAATVLVLREYEAKGPISDTIQTLTAFNNVACIVLFHAVFLLLCTFGAIDSSHAKAELLLLSLLLTTAGSLLLGVTLGFITGVLFAKTSSAEFLLILLALLLALGEGARHLIDSLHLSYSFLLTCVVTGATFANVAVDQERLDQALRSISGPIFAAFFVLAGYELHLLDLGVIGLIGAAYVSLRVVGKCLGGYVGSRWADSSSETRSYIGFGLLCQAGVAIGLVDFLCSTWGTTTGDVYVIDPMAYQLKTVILGSIVVFELAGPLVLKGVVVRSGEVKAITLLRRHQTPTHTSRSVTRQTWDALLRNVGLRRSTVHTPTKPLQVRHIMRSNIKLLQASAGLDEVLHFVETSRYNDFPVADPDGCFIGMIHFSELRKIIYDPSLRRLVTAMDLADPESHLLLPDMALPDVLAVFKDADTGLLPVVETQRSRKVIGLVEQRDLLRALHRTENPAQ